MSILSKRVVTLTVILAGLLAAAFPTFFPDSTDETVRIFVKFFEGRHTAVPLCFLKTTL